MSDGVGNEIRTRAEAVAREQGEVRDDPEGRLVYELKVHQIELEMQNQELLGSQQQIEQARREYEALFDYAPIAYFVFNGEGGIASANHAAASLIHSERRFLDRKPFVVFLPNEYHTVFFNHLRRVLDHGHRQSTELQVIARQGAQVWVRLESRQQRNARGEVQCLTAAIDITDRKRIEDDLIIAREDAISADRAKSTFLANMSHEIRTPMSGVLSMTELLLETPVSPEQREYLVAVQSATRSLVSILDDLLDVSRVEADRTILRREPFAVVELMTTLESLFAPIAARKQLKLEIEIDPGLTPILVGDRNRLRQVLVNLVSNAINFTERGSVVIRVTEDTVADFVHELTFEVADTGPGISGPEQHRLTEVLARAQDDPEVRFDGRGVGLAISRRLAKLMGGQLYFETEPGTGSRFYCSVPLETTPGTSAGTGDESDPEAGEPTGIRVLVAEDNAINLLVMRTILEKAGFEVEYVNNGFDAVQQLERSRFDVVLMDISMPGLDGIAATRAIRAHEPTETLDPDVPVVAISAHSMKGDREAFLEAGMNAYISKPFVRETVLSVIRDQLEATRHG